MLCRNFPGRKRTRVFFPLLHLGLHVAIPGITSRLAFREIWQKAWLIMALTMLVDFDHLLASPVYDPGRCGINFHPLHTYPAIGAYFMFLLIPRLRIAGVGLLLHMALDLMDCIW